MALVSKRSLEESASGWAQGGIAAVLDSQDLIDAHIRDTLVAGAWLNDEAATRFVVENGRRAIEWLLIAQGSFHPGCVGLPPDPEGGPQRAGDPRGRRHRTRCPGNPDAPRARPCNITS